MFKKTKLVSRLAYNIFKKGNEEFINSLEKMNITCPEDLYKKMTWLMMDTSNKANNTEYTKKDIDNYSFVNKNLSNIELIKLICEWEFFATFSFNNLNNRLYKLINKFKYDCALYYVSKMDEYKNFNIDNL